MTEPGDLHPSALRSSAARIPDDPNSVSTTARALLRESESRLDSSVTSSCLVILASAALESPSSGGICGASTIPQEQLARLTGSPSAAIVGVPSDRTLSTVDERDV